MACLSSLEPQGVNTGGLDPGWQRPWACLGPGQEGWRPLQDGCVFLHPLTWPCPLPSNAAHLLQLPPLRPALQDSPPLPHQVPVTRLLCGTPTPASVQRWQCPTSKCHILPVPVLPPLLPGPARFVPGHRLPPCPHPALPPLSRFLLSDPLPSTCHFHAQDAKALSGKFQQQVPRKLRFEPKGCTHPPRHSDSAHHSGHEWGPGGTVQRPVPTSSNQTLVLLGYLLSPTSAGSGLSQASPAAVKGLAPPHCRPPPPVRPPWGSASA